MSQDDPGREPPNEHAATPDSRQASFGTEDVLSSPGWAPGSGSASNSLPGTTPPTTRRRTHRSPWNRTWDRVVAALIMAACLTACLLVWVGSDSRATTSAPTTQPGPALPPPPAEVPGTLTEMWRAPSPATTTPVAEATAVMTGTDGQVVGRDPLTGKQHWRYGRDLPLCTVSGAWSRVLAVHEKNGRCGEVTQLDPGTGRRTAQRNGDAERGTQLINDGAHVTATGDTLLQTWRNDLVASAEYGDVPAKKNPDKQPRSGCQYDSVATSASRVGVIERCPGETADRLTVFQAAGQESDQPDVLFSTRLASRSATVVAMSGEFTAAMLPERRLLVIYGRDGAQRAAYPMDLPPADLAHDPPGGAAAIARTPSHVYWYTGSKTVAFSRTDLTPQWTLEGTLGPGALFGGQWVVPIPGGLAVLNERDGSTIRTVAVDRRGYQGPIRMATLGPMLLEQRGETLTALR